MSDPIQEAITTLSELKRLHQLNFELLEELNITCQWLIGSNFDIPNKEHLKSLLGKSLSLLNEVNSNTPQLLQYQKIADEKKQQFRADEEEPVPA